MEEEIKSLLEKNLKASEETLAILHKIRRETMRTRIFHGVKWLIIIGLIIFGILKIQPYVAYWSQAASSTSENIQKFNNFFGR